VATLHSKPGKQIHTRGTKESRKIHQTGPRKNQTKQKLNPNGGCWVDLHQRKTREQLQQTRNQIQTEVVELISTKKNKGATPTDQGPTRSRTQPNNGPTKVQHTRNPIQQEQGSESTKNPQLDPARPIARSNKTNSWVGRTQAKLNTRNSKIQQEEQRPDSAKGGCHPNVD